MEVSPRIRRSLMNTITVHVACHCQALVGTAQGLRHRPLIFGNGATMRNGARGELLVLRNAETMQASPLQRTAHRVASPLRGSGFLTKETAGVDPPTSFGPVRIKMARRRQLGYLLQPDTRSSDNDALSTRHIASAMEGRLLHWEETSAWHISDPEGLRSPGLERKS